MSRPGSHSQLLAAKTSLDLEALTAIGEYCLKAPKEVGEDPVRRGFSSWL